MVTKPKRYWSKNTHVSNCKLQIKLTERAWNTNTIKPLRNLWLIKTIANEEIYYFCNAKSLNEEIDKYHKLSRVHHKVFE